MLVPVSLPAEEIGRGSQARQQDAGIKIVISDRLAVEVSECFSSKVLRQVLGVLEER